MGLVHAEAILRSVDNHGIHVHFEDVDEVVCFWSVGGDSTRVASIAEDLSKQDNVLIHKHHSLLELAKTGLSIGHLADRGISFLERSDENRPDAAVGIISGFGKLGLAVCP